MIAMRLREVMRYISLNNNSNTPLKNEVMVLLTDKQVRYLEVLAMLKKKKGLSDTIRMIVEEYRKRNEI